MSRFKLALVCFYASCCLPNFSSSQEPDPGNSKEQVAQKNEQTDDAKIVITDNPKTVDPATTVYEPLAKKVTVNFKESSVREVVDWVREVSGVTVLVDEADLADEGILLSEPVTDRLNGEPLYLILNRLQSISLGWYVEDSILHITTTEMAAQHLSTVPHNVGKFFDQQFDPDDLTASIIDGSDPETWEDSGGTGTLILLGDVLFVRQSDEMHRKVSGLLVALEKHGRRTFIDDPPEHEALREKLNARVTVDFEDTPLSEAVKELATKTETDLRIDLASFRQARVREREPVSLKLTDQKLVSVLQALAAKLRLTWTLRNGVILVTTEQTAEALLKTAVFDVRDLSRNTDEADALAEAIYRQTEGQWLNLDGGPGMISFAKPGVMVVRNTEKILGEVLIQLENYRQALKIS
ncbi:MAG: hypothetical protein VX438_05840, partial [Planctomycetota bacterium]|nr:hypothetical protein [Planctomycetota bacterium]